MVTQDRHIHEELNELITLVSVLRSIEKHLATQVLHPIICQWLGGFDISEPMNKTDDGSVRTLISLCLFVATENVAGHHHGETFWVYASSNSRSAHSIAWPYDVERLPRIR